MSFLVAAASTISLSLGLRPVFLPERKINAPLSEIKASLSKRSTFA